MNPAIHEEVSKQVGGFFKIMEMQPLSLALVVMNFALVAFLFYSNSQVLTQRQNALDQIVRWQSNSDQMMASCVSIEVMKLVVDALERDRSLYRQMLPPLTPGQEIPRPAPAPAPLPPGLMPQKDNPLQHLLPPDRRTELEKLEVPYVANWPSHPPLPTPRPSTAPRDSKPANDGNE
jgi:hypothetical protein